MYFSFKEFIYVDGEEKAGPVMLGSSPMRALQLNVLNGEKYYRSKLRFNVDIYCLYFNGFS